MQSGVHQYNLELQIPKILFEQNLGDVDIGIKKELIDQIYSENEVDQLDATQKFRRLLSRDPNPPIEEVIQKGIVPRLVYFLGNNSNASLQVTSKAIIKICGK